MDWTRTRASRSYGSGRVVGRVANRSIRLMFAKSSGTARAGGHARLAFGQQAATHSIPGTLTCPLSAPHGAELRPRCRPRYTRSMSNAATERSGSSCVRARPSGSGSSHTVGHLSLFGLQPDALRAGVRISANDTRAAGELCPVRSTTTFGIGDPPPDAAGESFGVPIPNATDQVEVACTISRSTAFTVHVAAPNVTVDLEGSFPRGAAGTGSIAATFPSATLGAAGTDCALTPIAIEADGRWTQFDCARAANADCPASVCRLVGVLYVTNCTIG
jgi:hypothetical protein